jgi:hypothetical protein
MAGQRGKKKVPNPAEPEKGKHPLIEEEEDLVSFSTCISPPPRWLDKEQRQRKTDAVAMHQILEPPRTSPSRRRTHRGGLLHPLATMADQGKKLSSEHPLHKEARNANLIEICHPTPFYEHKATPRPSAGKTT